jgi:hypothetical protein
MSLSKLDWATMTGILVGTTKPFIFYYINVKSPNLYLKQGILCLEREGRGEDRETERKRNRQRKRERVRG